MKVCLLIPHYNHDRQFIAFLPKLRAIGLPAVVVDDGSKPESFAALADALEAEAWCHLHRLPNNRGKGAAAITGMTYARILGFTHALQIDADGQHATNDIHRFIELGKQFSEAIISGKPIFDAGAPKARVYGRKVTDFWVALETLSLQIEDSLCGFRLYPLTQMEHILDHYYIGARMDFDTEVLVKAVWLGIALKFIPTEVVYPEQNISHFNYLRDNLVLIKLHVRLMVGMLLRSPMLLSRRLRHLLHPKADL